MKAQALITLVAALLVLVQGTNIPFKTYTGTFPGGCYPVSLSQLDRFTATLSWMDDNQDLNIFIYLPGFI
jgi:hypothetical protein